MNAMFLTSWTLAPVTSSDRGTPRSSTTKCRLLPFFSPVSWVGTDFFLGHWSFYYSTITTLPFPCYTLHFIIFSKSGSPKVQKKSFFQPIGKVCINRSGAAKTLFRQRLPLTACPQNIYDSFKYLTRWQRLAPATSLTFIFFIRIASCLRNQRLYFFPKLIRYFP